MSERFGLSEEIITMITAVFARHPEVERAMLYGSRAMGSYRRGSDIDLALQGNDDLTERVLYKVLIELDDLPLPYSFDVALYTTITNKTLCDHIHRRGTLFYERAAQ